MEWNRLFDADNRPGYDDIEAYIGGGRELWNELFSYMKSAYGAEPKMSYSGCSAKPGWNVKFSKKGVSFGTLYPEPGGFSVFIMIPYKLSDMMGLIIGELSEAMLARYEASQDYMKMGRWMMFRVENKDDLRDYKLLLSVKLAPREGAGVV